MHSEFRLLWHSHWHGHGHCNFYFIYEVDWRFALWVPQIWTLVCAVAMRGRGDDGTRGRWDEFRDEVLHVHISACVWMDSACVLITLNQFYVFRAVPREDGMWMFCWCYDMEGRCRAMHVCDSGSPHCALMAIVVEVAELQVQEVWEAENPRTARDIGKKLGRHFF